MEEKGKSIAILVLQGALFFGNTDSLAGKIERMSKDTSIIILDMKRVIEIDPTGILVLKSIDTKMKNKGKSLFFSYLAPDSEKRIMLTEMGLSDPEREGRVFGDTNMALAKAEEIVLLSVKGKHSKHSEISLSETDILKGFNNEEIHCLRLERQSYHDGERIISQGEKADGFYLLVKGMVSIIKNNPDGHKIRLVDFGPGASVGEMALISGGVRTADVYAVGNSILYFLSSERFEAIQDQHSELSIKIIGNMAVILSARLAAASEKIQALEIS